MVVMAEFGTCRKSQIFPSMSAFGVEAEVIFGAKNVAD